MRIKTQLWGTVEEEIDLEAFVADEVAPSTSTVSGSPTMTIGTVTVPSGFDFTPLL